MSRPQIELSLHGNRSVAPPIYYGWVNLSIAAFAMVGTLPGRTQGLGLITESLLIDLRIDRVAFAQINLWATLIGALFCLGIGRLLDRYGSRVILTITSAMLGLVVILMSGVAGVIWLAALITLTRGLGQSALSVISLTMVGQWFKRRLNLAMSVYTVVLSVGFMIAFPIVGTAVIAYGWRVAWVAIGAVLLLLLAPLSWLLVRRAPESCGLQLDGDFALEEGESKGADVQDGSTFIEALRTSAFWVFAISSSLYGLIASGIALFNESILAERGFSASTYHRTLVITAMTALVGNFIGGWLAIKWSMNRLMSLAMMLVAASQLALPNLRSELQVAMYAVIMGLAGGFVMVIFFSFWGRAYGRRHLGKIQGAAQTLTVLASAIGPLLLAKCVALTGSYSLIFYGLAVVVTLLGLSAWFVKVPAPSPSRA